MRTILTILVCLIGIVSGHSPIFVSNDQNKMEIITDPTHSWAYYASTYLLNVFTHSYKADFEPGELLFQHGEPVQGRVLTPAHGW